MNNDDNLDLLDLDDGTSVDTLPDAAPFVTPRPKKPWLLWGVALLVIVLATYIIVRVIGGESSSSMDVDLDAPTVVVDGVNEPAADLTVPDAPVSGTAVQPVATVDVAPAAPVSAAQPAAKPVAQASAVVQPQPQPQSVGTPVRVIEDRKDVTFNPDKPAATKPKPKPAAKASAKPAAKPAPKHQAAVKGSWYVQFGSYSTRAAAEAAERQIRAGHSNLFAGRQFVILAAQLPNGTTTYRLRIAFATAADANGFCRNAKSDGLDCYVAK